LLSALGTYRLRLERKRKRVRSLRKRGELSSVVNRTAELARDDILLFCTLRNERIRLPFFLEYYRNLGVNHFMFVENNSDDGSREYLEKQPDVTLWTTAQSYKRSKFGVDWLNALQSRYGVDHWNLVVDVDEFFIYPFCDSRPLRALTDWLDASSIKSFGAMLVDMYPKSSVDDAQYEEGQNPFELAEYFDAGNYNITRNPKYGNLWIQGGARARAFFANEPARAPALTADSMFIILDGRFLVTKRLESGQEETIAEFGPGEHFGEIGMIDRGPRSATVTAASDGEVLELTRPDFERILHDFPDVRIRVYENFLESLCERLRLSNENLLLVSREPAG